MKQPPASSAIVMYSNDDSVPNEISFKDGLPDLIHCPGKTYRTFYSTCRLGHLYDYIYNKAGYTTKSAGAKVGLVPGSGVFPSIPD